MKLGVASETGKYKVANVSYHRLVAVFREIREMGQRLKKAF
jgi:hypothetical protein